jgi:transposase-like protein
MKESTVSKPQSAESSNSGQAEQAIPVWKHCPLCFNEKRKDKGIANVYAVRGRRRYMKCTRCGFTYSCDMDRVSRTVKIEHKQVHLEER